MESQPKKTTERPKEAKLWLRITKTFLLDACVSDTIGDIKDKINLFEGYPCEQQKLFFAGNNLEDQNTLADYNIAAGSIVDIDVDVNMQISIKIPSADKTLELDMNCWNTVYDLKVKIQDEVGLPSDYQLFVFRGETLKDNQVLIACGVRKDSVLHVMINPLAEMLLYVETSCGDFFSIEAVGGYTVRDVKLVIESLKGIPASRQKLFHDNRVLLDSFSLSFLKILHNSVIFLRVKMQIFVKIDAGKTIAIEAEDSETIAAVKAKIKGKTNLSMLNFKLLYSGNVLLKKETLAFYGIQSGSEIILQAKTPCDKYINLMIEQVDFSRPLVPPLYVRYQTTVAELKRLIEIFSGRKFIKMNLRCKKDGVELRDENLSLADYKVRDNTVLCLSSF